VLRSRAGGLALGVWGGKCAEAAPADTAKSGSENAGQEWYLPRDARAAARIFTGHCHLNYAGSFTENFFLFTADAVTIANRLRTEEELTFMRMGFFLCLISAAALATPIYHYERDGVRAMVRPHIVGSGNIDAVPPDPNYRTPPGSGYDGVGALLLETSLGDFLCSGSLLSSGQHVLTAAHCVTDPFGNNSLYGGSAFFFPNPTGTEIIPLSGVSIHPGWTGDLVAGNDIAIIELASAATAGAQRYEIYTSTDEISKTYNVAGFGLRGSFGQGDTIPAGARRQGKNTWDATLSDIGFGGSNVLMADFDSGLPANDGFRFFFGFPPHLGLGFDEVSTAPGDSGGPSFLNGKVAAITSFGATFSFMDGSSSDISPGILNSSWGEFDGMTRVSNYVDWINGPHTFVLIPEPGTLLLCGIALLGALAWRRVRSEA
jgi:hypothetical protein